MSEIDATTDSLVPAWLHLPDLAEELGVEIMRVRQLLKEHQFIAVRRGERGTLQVPAAFVQDGHLVKGLAGTLTVLADGGFDDAEILRWLFTPDDSLPGTPVDALRANRKTEVRRRAQAMAV